jgi:hypothetical protein
MTKIKLEIEVQYIVFISSRTDSKGLDSPHQLIFLNPGPRVYRVGAQGRLLNP